MELNCAKCEEIDFLWKRWNPPLGSDCRRCRLVDVGPLPATYWTGIRMAEKHL